MSTASNKLGLRKCFSDSQLWRNEMVELPAKFGSTTSVACCLDEYGKTSEPAVTGLNGFCVAKKMEEAFNDESSYDSTWTIRADTLESDCTTIVKAGSAPDLLYPTNGEYEKRSENVRSDRLRSKSC
ncbi:hypothetical protein M514_04125 [Trichuris suis]|uniref:Uncharacterized protein n=1 Tax=Trichuris suis TaxID=68888 RepID=A0A085MCJ7_9BILA|nr:hypothetical protein M513_04125 [Trichuris suis]KFD68420.1 hypothetical protein M514_04125 [Trichuris suis]